MRNALGLSETQRSKELDDWTETAQNFPLQEYELQTLERLRQALNFYYLKWNEEELIYHFIAPLVGLVEFEKTNQYRSFSQRTLEALIEVGEKNGNAYFQSEKPATYWFTGKIDWALAFGDLEPESPFFCLHEYKREFPDDPIGQLLAVMAAAQQLNFQHSGNYLPIRGCLVSGHTWWFVTLADRQYCLSQPYHANEADELKTIFQMLTALKKILEEYYQPT